jgi:hypothetical protein
MTSRDADNSETKESAILGMALGHAAISMLNAKNVISDAEMDRMMQTVLIGFEDLLDPNDPGVQMARKYAEGLESGPATSRGWRARAVTSPGLQLFVHGRFH